MARIEDYALLGDLQTAALVDRGGSVDWLCFPRFDSGACFAALLGGPDCGRWLLEPATEATSTRRYLHDTLVLETTWHAEDGIARVLDFMPPRGTAPDIVRIVEGVEGRVHFRSELTIRFDYGRIVPWVRKRTHEEDTRVALAGPDALCFRTHAPTRGEEMRTISEFSVDEGEFLGAGEEAFLASPVEDLAGAVEDAGDDAAGCGDAADRGDGEGLVDAVDAA